MVSQKSNIVTVIVFLMCSLILVSGCANSQWAGWMYGSHPNVIYQDSKLCVPGNLKRVLNRVAKKFGRVVVHSTNRWWLENWWKGGARKSWHLNCKAADFRVKGRPSTVIAFLKKQKEVGGYKYYPAGFYHIDLGPRRTW